MLFDLLRKREISPRLLKLRELSLFVNLTESELRHVDALLHERAFVADEVVFDEGEEGQALYIVLEGKISILRSRNGAEVVLASFGPGEFFGELALLDRGPRGAQAKAATNCRMAVLFREDLAGLLKTHAFVASKITLEMARHLARIVRSTTTPSATTVTL
jgi:CRP/FNR family cyclic AMP-dependent transcriptional regulator